MREKVFEANQQELRGMLIDELRAAGREVRTGDGWIYSPGAVPVMLVAHMDTVHERKPKIETSGDGGVWFASQGIGGDDRCGVCMVMETMRKHDCHVLFTEDEEIGGVGAYKFVDQNIKPDLKFMIEFDRKGSNDAVFYDCANEEFEQFITSYGFETAYGSFSDISILAPHLGVAAVNLSSGYYNPHTECEFVVWADVERVLRLTDAMLRDVPTAPRFEYMSARKSDSCFGNLLNTEIKSVSPFDGYLMWADGEMEEVCADDMLYFVDQDGRVYVDGAECLYPVDEATAYTHNNTPALYDDENGFEEYVMSQPWWESMEEIEYENQDQ